MERSPPWGHAWRTPGATPEATPTRALRAQAFHTATATLRAEAELGTLSEYLAALGHTIFVAKGVVAAAAYPAPGMRPFADFDLYVRSDDHEAIATRLAARAWQTPVDLHRGAHYLDDFSFDALEASARVQRVGNTGISTFSEEHHLRLVCLHALAEGVIAPLWLCDVAFLALRRSPDFDWMVFDAGDPFRARWARMAIDLARVLFALNDSGLQARSSDPPSWAIDAVLDVWGSTTTRKGMREPLSSQLQRPGNLMRAVRERWPTPIEAVAGLHRGIPRRWPLGYQVCDALRRGAGLAFGKVGRRP